MGGRTYYSKTILARSLTEIVKEVHTGKKNYKREIYDFLRQVRCLFLGHQIVMNTWRNVKNPNWEKEKDYELHIGCRRCPKFYIRKP